MNADLLSLIVGSGAVIIFLIALEILDKKQKNNNKSQNNKSA